LHAAGGAAFLPVLDVLTNNIWYGTNMTPIPFNMSVAQRGAIQLNGTAGGGFGASNGQMKRLQKFVETYLDGQSTDLVVVGSKKKIGNTCFLQNVLSRAPGIRFPFKRNITQGCGQVEGAPITLNELSFAGVAKRALFTVVNVSLGADLPIYGEVRKRERERL